MEKINVFEAHEHVADARRAGISVIGLGNMGISTVEAFVRSRLAEEMDIYACNRSESSTLEKLQARKISTEQIHIAESNDHAITQSDMVIVALKQNIMREEMLRWREKGLIRPEQLVVSFAAGVKTDTIQKWLGNEEQPVVRVMPNRAIEVGRGILSWYANDYAMRGQEKFLHYVLGKIGIEKQFENEDEINITTGVHGSGPAYVYRFAESIIKGGIEEGMSEEDAILFVQETLIGAAMQLDTSGESLSVLRQKITSKGGTTEAALASFEEDNLDQIVAKAMKRAIDRAREIADQFDQL